MNHFDYSDEEFLSLFKSCRLNPACFSHEAHLRLAWIHIQQFGLQRAEELVAEQIKNYTRYLGAEEKYNETVTVAAVKAVHHFMQGSDNSNFESFIAQNSKLNTNFKDLLFQHYSINIFDNVRAKSTFLTPDLLPF